MAKSKRDPRRKSKTGVRLFASGIATTANPYSKDENGVSKLNENIQTGRDRANLSKRVNNG